MAEGGGDGEHVGLGADDGDQVADHEAGVVPNDVRLRAAADPAEQDLVIVRAPQLRGGGPDVAIDLGGHVDDGGGARGAGLALVGDAERALGQRHRHQRQEDAQRVGERVGEHRRCRRGACGVRSLERLGDGGERGGVGERAGEETGEAGPVQAQRPAEQQGEPERREQHAQRQPVVAQAAPAQRGEEAGAAGQANRVDEQHQPELRDQVGDRGAGHHPADEEPGEEHRRHPEREPAEPDLSDEVAERRHAEEHQQRAPVKEAGHWWRSAMAAMRPGPWQSMHSSCCGLVNAVLRGS